MYKKKRGTVLITIVIVLFSIYAAFELIRLKVQIDEQKAENAVLVEQVNGLKTKNAELSDIANSDEDKEHIEDIAHDQLGYGYSGEQVFKDVSAQ